MILFIISILVIFLLALVSSSISVLVFSACIYLGGILICQTISYENRIKGYFVLNIVFSIYMLFALFHYMDAVVDWGYFANPGRDEYKFWNESIYFSQYASIGQIVKDCLWGDIVFYETRGYILYVGIIAYLADHIFDGNNLLLQFLGSVLWGVLMSVVFYKICLLYLGSKKSVKYALFYSLCTVAFVYSFKLLRDIHVAFFYMLSIYIVLKKFSIKGLLLLLLNVIIVWQLRLEHGLFLLVFVSYYLYDKVKRYPVLVGLLCIVIMGVFITYFMQSLETVNRSMEHYTEYTSDDALARDNSLGAVIYRLPSPLKEIAIVFYSQIQPFPSWYNLSNATNVYAGITSSVDIVVSAFWSIAMMSSFVWLLFYGMYKRIPNKFSYLLLIAITFLFLNTSNMNMRRIMCVYPIFFILYVWMKEYCVPRLKYIRTFRLSIFVYICMYAIYMVVKHVR